MEFSEIIMQRYATKLFDGRRIPENRVAELLELVRWAPSGLNIQSWKLKVIADADTKARLAAASYTEKQIESCSHLLVFCTDTDFASLTAKLDREMKERGIPDHVWDIVMGIADDMAKMPLEELRAWLTGQTYIALAYAILGAKTLGFDSCPMTRFVPKEYSRILELPPTIVPTVLCPIGYAADEAKPKWRYPIGDFLIR